MNADDTSSMTDLTERLRKRIAEASPLPWVYRPDQYDDWGWIRGVEQESEVGRYRPIVANAKDSNVRKEALDQHRNDKTDPYGPNALLITEGVNALPDLLTTLENLTQENARLREALEECAEELGNEIRARYSGMVDHPAMKLRYDRDMASVYATRKALGGGDE